MIIHTINNLFLMLFLADIIKIKYADLKFFRVYFIIVGTTSYSQNFLS